MSKRSLLVQGSACINILEQSVGSPTCKGTSCEVHIKLCLGILYWDQHQVECLRGLMDKASASYADWSQLVRDLS